MARDKKATKRKDEVKRLQKELQQLSDKLAETIKKHRFQAIVTGVGTPTPPRPKLEIFARVAYAGLLLEEAVIALRDLRK